MHRPWARRPVFQVIGDSRSGLCGSTERDNLEIGGRLKYNEAVAGRIP